MIKTIEKENCLDNMTKYKNKYDYCNLIIGSEGVIFFKIGDNIIVDNMDNDVTKKEFEGLYQYNKMYLSYNASNIGSNFQKYYFLKGNEKSLCVSETIFVDEQTAEEQETILTRNEIEQLLDKSSFNSIFLMKRNGQCEYAYDRNTGLEFGDSLIPASDNTLYKEIYTPGKFGKYSHFLLTSFNNQFYLMWFRLEEVEKDKFKMVTGPIEVLDLNLEDVLTDATKYIKDFEPDENLYMKENICNKETSRVRIIDRKSN